MTDHPRRSHRRHTYRRGLRGRGALRCWTSELQPLPQGEIGEIHIGGVGLSPGYWRDAEKTAAAFRLREDGHESAATVVPNR